MTARLILVCHASTEAVRRAAFPAGDEPLDERGWAQAAQLATHLPHAERSYTSPELRTRQTAQALRLDAVPLAALRECDYGNWSGRDFDAIRAENPDAVASWLSDPMGVPHRGESVSDLIRRVGTWLSGEGASPGRAIVVTHATIIRAAVVHALGAPPQSFWRIDVAPLSLTRLSATDDRWNLASLGCATRADTRNADANER